MGSSNPSIDTATLDLLSRWKREDVLASPEDILAAERELIEFKKAMNDNRAQSGEALLFP